MRKITYTQLIFFILFLLPLKYAYSVGDYLPLHEYLPVPQNPDKLVNITPGKRVPFVILDGNMVVTDENVFKILNINPFVETDEEEMKKAIERLIDFYKQDGFDIVDVAYRRIDGRWYILIDEGLLANIMIVGPGWFETYKYRGLLLPFDIFNRKRLEKELKDMTVALKAKSVEYELLKIGNSSVSSIFDKLKTVKNLADEFAGTFSSMGKPRYELHIFVKKDSNLLSFGYGLSYSSSYGFKVYDDLAMKSFVLPDDRFKFSSAMAVDRRPTIVPGGRKKIVWSLGELDAKWYTPTLGKDWLRIHVNPLVRTTNHHRPDLPLDQYQLLETSVSFDADIQYLKNQVLYTLFGYDYKMVHWVEEIAETPYTITNGKTWGFFTGLGLDIWFGKPRFDVKLNNYLQIEYLTFFNFDQGNRNWNSIEVKCQHVFFSRSMDLILYAAGKINFGKVEFYEESRLAEFVRGSIGKYIYIRKALSLKIEPRFNIYKRIIQASLFVDNAVYGEVNRAMNSSNTQYAVSLGPGLFVTFLDVFQLELFYAFGYTSSGNTSQDAVIGFSKIF